MISSLKILNFFVNLFVGSDMQDQLKASLEASDFYWWKHNIWIKWRLQSQSKCILFFLSYTFAPIDVIWDPR